MLDLRQKLEQVYVSILIYCIQLRPQEGRGEGAGRWTRRHCSVQNPAGPSSVLNPFAQPRTEKLPWYFF